jgi:Fur family ferric uptake transcriptional regulator
MTASYQQVAYFPPGLIRELRRRAPRSDQSRPALTVASTGPTLDFESTESLLRDLRGRGLRISMARRMIVSYLFEVTGPVSAQQIAANLNRTPLDLASVYRNLETLEEHGVVRHFHAGHAPGRYVLAGRGVREYLTCERCGAMEEVDPSELDRLRDDVRERFGYEVRFTHFPMVGRCPQCVQREGARDR